MTTSSADVVEHIGERVGLAAAPGRHVLQDRLLAEIEADDLGHVGIDRLVVGDAGADRVGERDVAGAVGVHQAGHAQRRIGAEGEGIEEIVVEAAVDHVDALRPLGGAHVDDVVAHQQVAALDQLDAELVGEEGVLVVGAVERTRREQGDRRLVRRGVRRHRVQRRQQLLRIVLDRGDAVEGEEVGEEPHHHFAVLQHVGDAGGRAGVVLQHVEVGVVDAHDVDAGDLHVDAVGQLQSGHLGPEIGVAVDQFGRDQAGLEDFARRHRRRRGTG